MKNNLKKFTFLMVAAGLMYFALSPVFAACPVTNCDTDCGNEGRVCSITQYGEDKEECSWTMCYGKGYKWDEELEPAN
jgi:hypothetical protein